MTPGLTYKELQEEKAEKMISGNELYMDDINADLLRNFEPFLVKQGNENTRAKKFELLGNWFKDAIKEGKTEHQPKTTQ